MTSFIFFADAFQKKAVPKFILIRKHSLIPALDWKK